MLAKDILRTNAVARLLREQINKLRMSSDSPFKSIIKNLTVLELTQVLDVGANIGQFGIDIRRHGFNGQIISFEPASDAYETLSRTIKKHQPWEAFHLGLGSSESQELINISGNAGLSSSLLRMNPVHIVNFPESKTVSTQKVSISTVDRQIDLLGIDPKSVMLKVDVQGYESEVLKGASRYLLEIPLCYLEVSMISLYEGEITFLPILNMLSESGHQVIDVFRGLKTKKGQLLQLDVLTRQINT